MPFFVALRHGFSVAFLSRSRDQRRPMPPGQGSSSLPTSPNSHFVTLHPQVNGRPSENTR
ncbi:hypothetical protein C8T65DRAFT_662351 [Cerioporus squamosus]|nr:hypothetical protein C8T65DRAFT_662351 [Cerioporus squamosus]